MNFEFGEEIGEGCFSSCHKRGTKKNSESPRGIQPQKFVFHTVMLYHLATPWWTRPPLGSYAIRVLDTTRIRNVASVMFDETHPSLFLNWAQNLPSFLFYWQTSFSTLDNCNILHCCRQLFFSILNNRLAIGCGCYAYLSKLFLFLVSNVRVRVKKPSPTVRQTSVTY